MKQLSSSTWNKGKPFFPSLFLFKHSFTWCAQVVVAAHRIFSCSMWDPVPWPGMEPRPPGLGPLSLSHWTTREVPKRLFWNVSIPHCPNPNPNPSALKRCSAGPQCHLFPPWGPFLSGSRSFTTPSLGTGWCVFWQPLSLHSGQYMWSLHGAAPGIQKSLWPGARRMWSSYPSALTVGKPALQGVPQKTGS